MSNTQGPDLLWKGNVMQRPGISRKRLIGAAAIACAAGIVYAVVAPPGYSRPWELFASPAGLDAWARVGHLTAGYGTLAVAGRAAWFGSTVMGRTYLWATADGVRWHRYPFRCPGSAGVPSRYFGLASIAAASPAHVVFLCMSRPGAGSAYWELLTSANGGRTTHLVGPAQYGADSGVIAVPRQRPSVITLAASDGNGVLYRSADGGRSWRPTFTVIGGTSWNSLSYVSSTAGWVMTGEPAVGRSRLLRTSDGGASWHQVRF
jgi:hypothetical protein